jgi:hypothetical protein
MNKGAREPTAAVRLAQSSELLGLPRDARVLIINADDFGMYQAVNTAVIRSIEEGSSRAARSGPPGRSRA